MASSQLMGSSPHEVLSNLTSFLRKAAKPVQTIVIPAEIDGSIDDLIKSHHSGQYLFAGSDTGSLAETLEIGGRSICGRLSSRAFILLFAILRLSEACMALQRALYLLAVSRKLSRIYEDHSPDVNKESLQEEDGTFSVAQSTQDGELTPLQRKKKKIGHELLNRSFSAFCNERISPFIRRWMGLLSLELIKDSHENQGLLAACIKDQRGALGEIISKDRDTILRFIAGSIVKEMLSSAQVTLRSCWPKSTDSITYGNFPKLGSSQNESQWVEQFMGYADDVLLQELGSNAFNSFVLSVTFHGAEQITFDHEDYPSILISVRRSNLSVLMAATSDRGSLYTDIFINQIENAEAWEVDYSTSFGSLDPHQVDLTLHVDIGNNVYQNARGSTVKRVSIVFLKLGPAEQLVKYLHKTGMGKFRGSQATDILDLSQMPSSNLGKPKADAELASTKDHAHIDEDPLHTIPLTTNKLSHELTRATALADSGTIKRSLNNMNLSPADHISKEGSSVPERHEGSSTKGHDQQGDATKAVPDAIPEQDTVAASRFQPHPEDDLRDPPTKRKRMIASMENKSGRKIDSKQMPENEEQAMTAPRSKKSRNQDRTVLQRPPSAPKSSVTQSLKSKATEKSRLGEANNSLWDLPTSPPAHGNKAPSSKRKPAPRSTARRNSVSQADKGNKTNTEEHGNKQKRKRASSGSESTKAAARSSRRTKISRGSDSEYEPAQNMLLPQRGQRQRRNNAVSKVPAQRLPESHKLNPNDTSLSTSSSDGLRPASTVAARASPRPQHTTDDVNASQVTGLAENSHLGEIRPAQPSQNHGAGGIKVEKGLKQKPNGKARTSASEGRVQNADTGAKSSASLHTASGVTSYNAFQWRHEPGKKSKQVESKSLDSRADAPARFAGLTTNNKTAEEDNDLPPPADRNGITDVGTEAVDHSQHFDNAMAFVEDPLEDFPVDNPAEVPTMAADGHSPISGPAASDSAYNADRSTTPRLDLANIAPAIGHVNAGTDTTRAQSEKPQAKKRSGHYDGQEDRATQIVKEKHQVGPKILSAFSSVLESENLPTNLRPRIKKVASTQDPLLLRLPPNTYTKTPLGKKPNVSNHQYGSVYHSKNRRALEAHKSTANISNGNQTKNPGRLATTPRKTEDPSQASRHRSLVPSAVIDLTAIDSASSASEEDVDQEVEHDHHVLDSGHTARVLPLHNLLEALPKQSADLENQSHSRGPMTPRTPHKSCTEPQQARQHQRLAAPAAPKSPRTSKVKDFRYVDDTVLKRPTIISFSAKGPLNQGRLSGGRLPIPAPLRALPGSKLPLPSQRHQSQRSQKTLVAENGSPIASQEQRVESVAKVDARTLVEDLPSEGFLLAEDVEDDLPTLPPRLPKDNAIELPRIPSAERFHKNDAFLSSNRKNVPSSPAAPSRMLEDLEIHKEQPEGYVDVRDASLMRAALPQDPFNRNRQRSKGPSKFIQRLHNASARRSILKQPKPVSQSPRDSGSISKKMSFHDPDLTLVNSEIKPERPVYYLNDDTGSSSPITSEKTAASAEEVDQETKRAEATERWQQSLRKDQAQTLTHLYDFSNRFVRHLNSKEAVFEDIVSDYKSCSLGLIKEFEQKQLQGHSEFVASAKSAVKDIDDSLANVQKQLLEHAEKVKWSKLHISAQRKMASRSVWRQTLAQLEDALG